MKKAAVVILNYNGKKWLETFLPSVIQFTSYDWCSIVVADNCSTDGSKEFLLKEYKHLTLIFLDANTGYAGGYNNALAQLQSEYYILLNSDVELTENWLAPLLQFMDATPSAGAVQPMIKSYMDKTSFEYAGAAGGFIDVLGYPFCRGRIFDTVEEDCAQYNSSIECHWASGACLCIRSDVFDKAGKLDADFFAHMEEIDLCWRVRMLGYSIHTISSSVVYHYGGGTLPQGNPRKTYLNFRNNLQMIFKNQMGMQMPLIILMRLIMDGLAGIQALFLKQNPADVWAIVEAHWHFFFSLPALWSKRKKINHSKVTTYPRSIVIDYFIFNKKKYSNL